MLKLAVLVSGGGTNLQAIIDSIADGRITNAEIKVVISNNKNAYALERAAKAGIPAKALSPKNFTDREAFNDALLQALIDSEADLVVLAGCLVVIPPKIVEHFKNRIINIHPSLIPSFCGKALNKEGSSGSRTRRAPVSQMDCPARKASFAALVPVTSPFWYTPAP